VTGQPDGPPVRTLVVDDETLIAEAHAQYVGRVAGFAVAGAVHSGAEALRFVRDHPVDLMLLDFNLPDGHGLDVCRALRAARSDVDVIAVTSTRDLAAVRSAVSLGVVHYLLKPFTFASLRDKLERYRDFRNQTRVSPTVSAQSEIDRAFASLRGSPLSTMPAGLSEDTLESVTRLLQAGVGMSAGEVAAACGVSRVTARRYLEHLTDSAVLRRRQRHGNAGRPEIEYQWRAP
jgi:response regulator of citrate/malate metabolism